MLTITQFEPTDAQPGESIEVTGTDFPGAVADLLVAVGDIVCPTVHVESSTGFSFTVPANAVSGRIRVTVGDTSVQSTEDLRIRRPVPTISFVRPATVPPQALLRVYGTHLDEVQRITFNGNAGPVPVPAFTASANGDQLSFAVPATLANGNYRLFLWCRSGARVFFPMVTVQALAAAPILRWEMVAPGDQTLWEREVVSAWNAVFKPGDASLPGALEKEFSSVSLPDPPTQRISRHVLDICSAGNPNFGAKHYADFTSTEVVLENVGSVTKGGEPTFSKDGDTITFPLDFQDIEITGDFQIRQECEECALFICHHTGHMTKGGRYRYKLSDGALKITATVTVDAKTKARTLVFAQSSVSFSGHASVDLPRHESIWEKIGSVLSGWMLADEHLAGELKKPLGNILDSAAVHKIVIAAIQKQI